MDNQKWVTDISYIPTKQGTLYLSIIRDLFDLSIVAYKTSTRQSIKLVLDTVRLALEKEEVTAELQLHSDQGFQYASQSYFALTTQYGITPSMSRRANPYDNAMAENFFSILKSECIRLYKPETILQAQTLIDEYTLADRTKYPFAFYTLFRCYYKAPSNLAPTSFSHSRMGKRCVRIFYIIHA